MPVIVYSFFLFAFACSKIYILFNSLNYLLFYSLLYACKKMNLLYVIILIMVRNYSAFFTQMSASQRHRKKGNVSYSFV